MIRAVEEVIEYIIPYDEDQTPVSAVMAYTRMGLAGVGM